jgi:BirA family biotin operon repressor/biotin-[acetyl-CoA-carboxylase] ligase
MKKAEKLLLETLSENLGEYVSGQAIADKLGVSRTVVWTASKELKNRGFEIISNPRKGMCLTKMPDFLSENLIKKNLSPDTQWNYFTIDDEMSNTNDVAKSIIRDNQMPKTGNFAVLCTKQTAGRGRRGREFVSPPGGLYMTVGFIPNFNITDSQYITAMTAVAVSEAIDKVTSLETQIKWVNDIYYNSKKLCGISTEASISVENSELNYILIGIGINVAKFPDNFSDNIKKIAVSLEDLTGEIPDKNLLAAEVLNNLQTRLKTLETKDFLPKYRSRSCVLGKQIKVIKPSSPTPLPALALEIDDSAALLVQYPDGSTERLNFGEISLVL